LDVDDDDGDNYYMHVVFRNGGGVHVSRFRNSAKGGPSQEKWNPQRGPEAKLQ